MFNLGLQEILVISLIAIVFINPKDLPVLFRRLGETYRKIKDMRVAFLKTLEEVEEEAQKGPETSEGRTDASKAPLDSG